MTRAARIQALQQEARDAANIAVREYAVNLETLARQARELADMGDAVPVGIRQLAAVNAPTLTGLASTVRKLARPS